MPLSLPQQAVFPWEAQCTGSTIFFRSLRVLSGLLALVWELIVTNFHVPVGSMAPLSAAMLRAETI